MAPSSTSAASLRGIAKRRPRGVRSAPVTALSKQALVHELRVHQVELEQQNEELRQAQIALAAGRDRFIDLFDFAPVGYLTVDREDRIVEANLTVAAEFALERRAMLSIPFARFVAPSDADRWQRLRVAAMRGGGLRRIELVLTRQDGRPFHALLECLRVVRTGSTMHLRITLSDISQRKLAETNRRIATSGNVARESERRRIAHMLHEDLAQRLSALKMRLGSVAPPERAAAEPSAADSMAVEIDQALAVVRRLSTDLHPLILDNLGLNAALDWLASDVASRLRLAVEMHLEDNDASIDESLAIALYRLAETALEHFARHVDGGIGVELLRRPHDLILQFQSAPGHAREGALFANVTRLPESFMDRVHLLGGRLEISDMPGDVRRMSVFVPTQV